MQVRKAEPRITLQPPETIVIDGIPYPNSMPVELSSSASIVGRPRYVYVVAHGHWAQAMSKIGITRNLEQRLEGLNASSPVTIRLHASWSVPDYAARWVESAAHEILRHKHHHNEWFKCDPYLAVKAVGLALRYVPSMQHLWRLKKHDFEYWKEIVRIFRTEEALYNSPHPLPLRDVGGGR